MACIVNKAPDINGSSHGFHKVFSANRWANENILMCLQFSGKEKQSSCMRRQELSTSEMTIQHCLSLATASCSGKKLPEAVLRSEEIVCLWRKYTF